MINNFTEIKNTKHTQNTIPLVETVYNTSKNVKLDIKEEQLDITKKWMQTEEVNVYRETFTVKKHFTLEVEREELVIEKKAIHNPLTDSPCMDTEIIRIPLSEENVKFTKHKIALEDVSIYKQKIKDIKSIETTLKKEKLKVEISGDLKIKD